MKLLDEKKVAEILGISPLALRKQRCLGETPGGMPIIPWKKLGARVRYVESDVLEYVAALPTHGEGAA